MGVGVECPSPSEGHTRLLCRPGEGHFVHWLAPGGGLLRSLPSPPPIAFTPTQLIPAEEHWGGGRGSRLTGSSILGYMLGTSAAFKLFPDWEGARGVGDCLEEKRNHTEHQRANGGGSLETIKMWAMYKSSRELIKMQGFQKLGKLATACSHL